MAAMGGGTCLQFPGLGQTPVPLAGLLAYGTCGRKMESAWSHGKLPTGADSAAPRHGFVREF